MRGNISDGSRVRINPGGLGLSGILPAFSLLFFCLLTILVLKIGLSKILEQRKTITELKKKETVLIEKKKKLEKAEKEVVPIYFGLSSTFLPTQSPILTVLGEVKRLISEYLLPVEDYGISLAASDENNNQILGDGLRFEVVGDFNQVMSFSQRIESFIPLMSVKKISFSSEGELLSVVLEIQDFWSSYNKLSDSSKVAEQTGLEDLTREQKEALDILSKMERLQFNNLPSPSGPYTRTNPFVE